MVRTIPILLIIITVFTMGCSKKESLEKYSVMIMEVDLYKVMSYSGSLEKQVQKSPEGVHLTFGTEEFISSNARKGHPVFVGHVEYMVVDVKELKNDMKDREPVRNVGDCAWYDKFGNGYNELIFYTSAKNIIVQLGGHTEGSDHDPSTFIDKDALIQLSQMIESRL